jgi:hypothetical protein
MTDGQIAASCPQCGSSAAVHSIGELAAMARNQLGQAQPGPQAGPQAGWAAEPQAGPVPGWAAQPQAGPVPGYAAQPQAGPVPGSWSGRSGGFGDGTVDGLEQAVADVALGAAARFIGRAVSRRLQRAVSERVLPAVAAGQETVLREQVAIAERYPGIRACLTDSVIFLAGGSQVLPMPDISRITLQQADALVAQLKEG